MIISVSIVDKHKPTGQKHVGTYTFEIDYPGDSHFDLLAVSYPVEKEADVRYMVGRLMKEQDFIAAGEEILDITAEKSNLLKALEESDEDANRLP